MSPSHTHTHTDKLASTSSTDDNELVLAHELVGLFGHDLRLIAERERLGLSSRFRESVFRGKKRDAVGLEDGERASERVSEGVRE